MQAIAPRSLVEATRGETDVGALVWDRAPGHRDAMMRVVGLALIEQPPYAPELNPAERVFEVLRPGIEGVIYPSPDDKVAAVEAILVELDADPERATRLTGWHAGWPMLSTSCHRIMRRDHSGLVRAGAVPHSTGSEPHQRGNDALSGAQWPAHQFADRVQFIT